MYVVREIVYCKPGKVRPLVEKFKAMNALSKKVGFPSMRILTDFCGERYWTLIAEMEVENLQAFEQMMATPQGAPEDLKQLEEIMSGYHDLVQRGRREIYKVEA